MKADLLLIVLVAALGCATHVVSSNPRSVIVGFWWMDAAKAQGLADGDCSKYSRVALMTVKADPYENNTVFECVDR